MKNLVVLFLIVIFGGGVMVSPGPAPNSGDGIPDGSSLEAPNGPNGSASESEQEGPAPNSGDGVPDGSGF